jgi:hypothetical protein
MSQHHVPSGWRRNLYRTHKDWYRTHKDWLGRGHLPVGVHESDVAGLDNLLNTEVENRSRSGQWGQLLSHAVSSFFTSPD